jgi:hypothetical protein
VNASDTAEEQMVFETKRFCRAIDFFDFETKLNQSMTYGALCVFGDGLEEGRPFLVGGAVASENDLAGGWTGRFELGPVMETSDRSRAAA